MNCIIVYNNDGSKYKNCITISSDVKGVSQKLGTSVFITTNGNDQKVLFWNY